jgi:hypothetical protein
MLSCIASEVGTIYNPKDHTLAELIPSKSLIFYFESKKADPKLAQSRPLPSGVCIIAWEENPPHHLAPFTCF